MPCFATDQFSPQENGKHLRPSVSSIQRSIIKTMKKHKIQTSEEVPLFPTADVQNLATRGKKFPKKIFTNTPVIGKGSTTKGSI